MIRVEYFPLLSAAFSGGVVSWAATWLNEKSKSRAYIMGAVDSAVEVALKSATAEIERLNREMEKLRKSHEDCDERNKVQQKELSELRDKLDDLMAGKVASYGEANGRAE